MGPNISPWSVFEVLSSTTDYNERLELSSDLSTVTITDDNSSARIAIQKSVVCTGGDVLEFFFEAEPVSGTMSVSIQVGTSSLVELDIAGGNARSLLVINEDCGSGFKPYHIKYVVPYSFGVKTKCCFFVGGTAGNVGCAKFRNPKLFINGTEINNSSSVVRSTVAETYSYLTEILSTAVVFNTTMQANSTTGFVGDPFFFNVGAFRQGKKIIGSGQIGSSVAQIQYGAPTEESKSSYACVYRFLKSAASGPGEHAEPVDGSVMQIDAFYDSDTDEVLLGRIVFNKTKNNDDGRTFYIITQTNDGEDRGLVIWNNGNISPSTDLVVSCGTPAHRFSEFYAGTDTINTSDSREKQSIEAFPDAVLDAWGNVELRQFLFNSAVEKKGDSARIHAGVIAQQVMEAFEAQGLDATRYGLLCYDEWEDEYEDVEVEISPAEYDEEGNETKAAVMGTEKKLVTAAGNRYGIRYSEALCLEAAYQRRRADRLEARLTALEERIAALETN